MDVRLGRRALLGAGAAMAFGCVNGCARDPGYPAGPLRIASGGTGGVYYAYAHGIEALVRLVLPGLRPAVLATAASVENLELVAAGSAEVGFTSADAAADAYRGHPPFAQPLPVLALTRLYESYLHLVVRRDRGITSVADLRGRPISIGAAASGTELFATRLLGFAGIGLTDLRAVRLDPDVAAEAVGSGALDGMFFSGGIPTAAVAQLARRTPVALLELRDYVTALRDRYGEVYMERTIPASTYGLAGPTVTVGVANYLFVARTMDDRVAYRLTQSLFDHRDMLAAAHPMGSRLDRVAAISTYPLPLHPGATRYYRDAKR